MKDKKQQLNIELYKMIKPTSVLNGTHMVSIYQRINLPTEIVIDKPQYVIPQQARIYSTYLYWVDDRIMDYKTLLNSKKAEGFKGISHYDSIVLVEIWSNYGDDGHTEYNFYGWRYVPVSRLEEELEDPLFKDNNIPLCINYDHDDYNEHYNKIKKYQSSTSIDS